MKLGRAIGYGTRHAAKTVAAVVEAAATPDPRAGIPASSESPVLPNASARPATLPRATANGDLRRRARGVWGPLAVFSGALWLRVTGVFFALVASTLGSGAWRLRAVLGGAAPQYRHRFWVFTAFAALFCYFAISSFVRASLKERRAAGRA